ncbi:hypothetical protein A8924_0613 [Saccharopolyspora erythraea NRRL 2338]|uniref:Uncharacterized protein n=1 Tax=Saccharopolyspora erythraea TaxID=1836 RepID=A0ABP3N285_SACER|nr:hypothetical protein [Saccharopolyspora erythraea]EQD88120.1 hypothetical protein N599_01130 [Saccharopolyspora erythraea D]PFG93375.1 hypothetical protein A8924_0613 [Saccharopolyspora erythraea NRRL 2338]QRK90210.1 hypothetical protein JQX30_01120 [Saccharopolyspora erythraea]
MGCTHAESCPLFPFLKASLRGWREHYCDSEDRWLECARYQVARTGQHVPISLLPNGRDAHYLAMAAEESRTAVTEPVRASDLGRAHQHERAAHERAARPEPRSTETTEQFGAVAQPKPPPRSPEEPPSEPREPARRRKPEKRGWWRRLADWMRGPA